MKYRNVLVIADTHIPFELPNYLDFCYQIGQRCKCDTVVHIGDVVDNHAISFHDHLPDGWSPLDEINEAKKHLVEWFKRFPKVLLTLGNHDCLVDRKGRHVGLPSVVFQPFRKIWDLPKGWKDDFFHEIYGVRFIHGTGYSGKYAHVQAAYDNRQSTVMGHTHSSGGVEYIANNRDCIFGMNVSCGIDRKRYAFTYGKDFKRKPIIGAGVVTDNGRNAQFFKMDL